MLTVIFKDGNKPISGTGKTEAPGGSTRTLEPQRLRQGTGRVQSPGVDGAELEHGATLRGPCLEVGPGGVAALPDPDTEAQRVTEPIFFLLQTTLPWTGPTQALQYC